MSCSSDRNSNPDFVIMDDPLAESDKCDREKLLAWWEKLRLAGKVTEGTSMTVSGDAANALLLAIGQSLSQGGWHGTSEQVPTPKETE